MASRPNKMSFRFTLQSLLVVTTAICLMLGFILVIPHASNEMQMVGFAVVFLLINHLWERRREFHSDYSQQANYAKAINELLFQFSIKSFLFMTGIVAGIALVAIKKTYLGLAILAFCAYLFEIKNRSSDDLLKVRKIPPSRVGVGIYILLLSCYQWWQSLSWQLLALVGAVIALQGIADLMLSHLAGVKSR